MQTEIEAKFLSVDHDEVRAKLRKLGAKLKGPMQTLTRVNMDFDDRRLEKKGGWVRIRSTNKSHATLTYKELKEWTLHGVKEVEVNVSDFSKAQQLLEAIGLKVFSYQITKRETWEYEEAEIVLDVWPWVKPYIEIEGPSETNVREIAKNLGFDWGKAVFGSVEPVYMAEFAITEKEFYTLERITFESPVPDWLEQRSRVIRRGDKA